MKKHNNLPKKVLKGKCTGRMGDGGITTETHSERHYKGFSSLNVKKRVITGPKVKKGGKSKCTYHITTETHSQRHCKGFIGPKIKTCTKKH